MPQGVGGPGPLSPPVKPDEGAVWRFVGGRWQAADIAGLGVTLPDDKFTLTGSADATKTLKFELDGQDTGCDLTLNAGAQTADRTLTLPVLTGNDTLAALGVAQTFTAAQTFGGLVTAAAGVAHVTGTATPSTATSTSRIELVVATSGQAPSMIWVNQNGALDTKVWDFYAGASTLNFRGINDAYGAAANWLTVTRSGLTFSSIALAAPVTMSGTLGVTGVATLSSTTASTSTTTGALVVSGGLGVAGAINVGDGGVYAWRTDLARRGRFYTDTTATHLDSNTSGNDPLYLESPGATGQVALRVAGANIGLFQSSLITLSQPVTASSTLTVTGAATLSSTLTVTGNVTVGSNTGVAVTVAVNGQAAGQPGHDFQIGGLSRFKLRLDSGAESGSDAGSGLQIQARTDAGAFIDNVLSITRAAGGLIQFSTARTAAFGPISASNCTYTGGVTVGTSGTGNLTMTAGTHILLGNTAIAATPVATHTMTIKDAAGTTYRVLCVV